MAIRHRHSVVDEERSHPRPAGDLVSRRPSSSLPSGGARHVILRSAGLAGAPGSPFPRLHTRVDLGLAGPARSDDSDPGRTASCATRAMSARRSSRGSALAEQVTERVLRDSRRHFLGVGALGMSRGVSAPSGRREPSIWAPSGSPTDTMASMASSSVVVRVLEAFRVCSGERAPGSSGGVFRRRRVGVLRAGLVCLAPGCAMRLT